MNQNCGIPNSEGNLLQLVKGNIKLFFLNEYMLMFLLALFCFLFFYREMVFNGFDPLPGDPGDARLNILTADAWQDYFSGKLPLRQTRFFYPFGEAQGFTDLSLSLYLFEIPFRLCGMDAFRSAQAVYIIMFFLAVMTMFHLCRQIFRFSFSISAFCALFAFLNHAFWLKQIHTQFYFLYLMPLLGICLFRYFQLWNVREKKTLRMFYISAACLVYALISYSNFYSAFYFAIWFSVFLLILFFLLIRRGKFSTVNLLAKSYEFIIAGLWLFLLHLPFLTIYYPVVKSGYKRTWIEVTNTLPMLTDVLNIGGGNFFWGKLYTLHYPNIHKNIYELSYGLTPMTLLLTMTLGILFLKVLQQKNSMPPWFIALAFSLPSLYFLSLILYPRVSLWYVIWKFFPGGSGIRACGRIYVFMMLPLTIFLGGMLNFTLKNFKIKHQKILFQILFLLIFADNLNTNAISTWKYSDIMKKIKQVPVPPEECKIFFLAPEKIIPGENDPDYFSSMDAWHIASNFQLFTLNGYSGNFPPDWYRIFDITGKDYMAGVEAWIRKYDLQNVYQYDRKKRVWTKFSAENKNPVNF